MKKNFISLILIGIILTTFGFSQSRVNEWKHYTSILDFTDMTEREGMIYFSSGGGIVEFNPADKSFQVYTTESGLTRINLEAITKDTKGNFWVGSGAPVGEINVFDPVKGSVVKIFNNTTWNQ